MQKTIYIIIGAVLIFGAIFYWLQSQRPESSEYNPVIEPDNFVSKVDNKYFTLNPGTKFTYEKRAAEGLERIEVVVTDEPKKVMGITTTVVWDRVWLNNELIEDTKDWYAQDKNGNVWYFGEEVANYENGKLKDHAGSWEAGIDGAKPGIIMLANPKVGDSYRQEYYQGQAEDMGDIVTLDKKITVPYGTFDDCLQTRDWSRIDKNANEYKYYCPEAGFVVMEELVAGGPEKVELVSISTK